MKKRLEKLQLKKRTVTHLQQSESQLLQAGSLLTRLNCEPTFFCVSVNVCPTTTLPSANCTSDL
ncbi:MAG: hypothetical protein JNM68_01060 [Dinghuibacter sp.]|nr:hypothetical protein [Dinghuibacter sp.]